MKIITLLNLSLIAAVPAKRSIGARAGIEPVAIAPLLKTLEPIGSPPHPKNMIEEICPKCGKPNVSQSAWCEYCLTYFNEYGKDVILYCPECAHPNDYNSSHCEVCYEPLKPGQVE